MQFILWVSAIIFVGNFIILPVHANPTCGPAPQIQNEILRSLIDTVAGNFSKSSSSAEEIKSAIETDLAKFEEIRGDQGIETVRQRFFYAACSMQVRLSDGEKSKFSLIHAKLQPFVDVLGATPPIQQAMERLKQGEYITETHPVRPQRKTNAKNFESSKLTTDQKPSGLSARSSANNKTKLKITETRVLPSPKVTKKTLTRGFNMTAAAPVKMDNRKSECEKLGVLGTSDCIDFESVVRNLKQAPLAYNHPKSMYLGKRTQISLVIKTGQEDHKKELDGLPGKVVSGKSRISRVMQAELSGSDFRIEPSGRQSRTLTSLAPVKWTWFVTPLEEGRQKRLNLELSAILREGTRDLPPVTIRTFRTQIEVDVRWWDLIIHRISAFDPIYQLATALGGLATAFLFIWRIVSWRRNKPGVEA